MFDLEYKRLMLEDEGESQGTQLPIESVVILPDVNPDIRKILRLCGKISVDDESVSEGRISFRGDLALKIIYEASDSEKAVKSMDAELPFEDFINLDGVSRDSRARLKYKLNMLEASLINDRKISIKAVVTVEAEKLGGYELDIVTGISGDESIQTRMGSISLNSTICGAKDSFTVKENFELPQSKPNISEALDVEAGIRSREVRVGNGVVTVRGTLGVTILYTGNSEESIAEVYYQDIPFSGTIDCKNAEDGMTAMADITVGSATAGIGLDSDGEERIFEVEIPVSVAVTVFDSRDTEALADAYSLDKQLNVIREDVSYIEYSAKGSADMEVRDTLTIDKSAPPILEVRNIWNEVEITDAAAHDGRVQLEGVVKLEILYIAADDSSPVNVVPFSIPFSHEIEVAGSKHGMDTDVIAFVKDINFNLLSDNEVELRVALSFDVLAKGKASSGLITGIEYSDSDGAGESGAAIVIYVVQKGDSLWSIAKKYGTTVDSLIEMNDIENPDRIYPGEKLLIVKEFAQRGQ